MITEKRKIVWLWALMLTLLAAGFIFGSRSVYAAGTNPVEVTLEGLEERKAIVNKEFTVHVHVEGKEIAEGKIKSTDEDEKWPDYSLGYCEDGDYYCGWTEGNPGNRGILARVRYEGEDDWVESDPVTFEAVSYGQVGNGLNISVEEESVPRGGFIHVTYTKSENANCYRTYFAREHFEDGEEWYYDSPSLYFSDDDELTAVVSTANLVPGTYHVGARANGVGYVEYGVDDADQLVVTDADVAQDGILFAIDKNEVETCEEFPYSIYAPGADRVELYPDDDDDEWIWDSSDGDCLSGYMSFRNGGKRTMQAIAYKDDMPYASKELEINVTAPLDANLAKVMMEENEDQIPTSIKPESNGSYKDQTFTVTRPDGAAGFWVSCWIDGYDGDGTIFWAETTEESMVVTLPADKKDKKLEEGMQLCFQVNVWGRGYENTEKDVTIPVVGKTNNNIKFEVTDPENLDDIIVNKDIRAVVQADGMKEVQFFNGYEYEGPDDFDDEKSSAQSNFAFFDTNRHNIFARVRFEEDGAWFYSNEILVTAGSNGQVGPFGLYMYDNDFVVTRGDFITVLYGESENATHYWIDIEKYYQDPDNEDEGDYDYYCSAADAYDLLEATFSTAQLEPGSYRVTAKADAVGYEEYHNEDDVYYFTVNDIENMPESGIIFTTNVSEQGSNEIEVDTCEEFAYSVYAPGADFIRVYPDWDYYSSGEDNDPWIETNEYDDGGDSLSGSVSYRHSGTMTMVAEAYKDGELYKDPVEIKVTVKADNDDDLAAPIMEQIPDFIEPDAQGKYQDVTFTIDKPEGAQGFRVNSWIVGYDGDEDADDLFWDETYGDSMDVILRADMKDKEFEEGMVIGFRVDVWGRGYEETDREVMIPVIGKKDDQIIVSIADKTEDDLDNLLVNEDLDVCIQAGDDVQQIQVFDGYNYQDIDDPAESGVYHYNMSFWIPGTYKINARIKKEGENDWTYSEYLRVTVTTHGQVGAFQFTTDKKAVTTGGIVTATLTKAENADHYWLDISKKVDGQWEWIEHFGDKDEPGTITINTGNLLNDPETPLALEPGEYLIEGKANGVGYVEITFEQELIIADPISQSIQIKWSDKDNKDKLRAEMKATISNAKNSSTSLGTVVLNEAGNWKGTINSLDEYNTDGSKAQYKWTFTPPENYTSDGGVYDQKTATYTFTLTLANSSSEKDEAEKKAADQRAADAVSAKLNALKGSASTIADEAAISEARKAYDALTDDQKKLISADALKKLTDSENQITTLKAKPAVGETFSQGGLKFKVTSSTNISLIKTSNKKNVTIPATITYKGVKMTVTGIGAKAFPAKVRKVTIKTGKLTKKGVKNCLKKSKVKTIKVSVGNKKANKKAVKKYKKYFTKKNAGKKVTVK